MSSLPKSLRLQVFAEAQYRCQYCRTSARLVGMPLVIDHIIPTSANGSNERENLAASCYRCNEFKGVKTRAVDPTTGKISCSF